MYKIKQLSDGFKKKLITSKLLKKNHCSSRQLLRETVTVGMVSGYCVFSYISYEMCISSILSGILRYM